MIARFLCAAALTTWSVVRALAHDVSDVDSNATLEGSVNVLSEIH